MQHSFPFTLHIETWLDHFDKWAYVATFFDGEEIIQSIGDADYGFDTEKEALRDARDRVRMVK